MKERRSGRAGIHAAIRESKAVLFDFDFTLADSSVGIIACINYGLKKLGLPEAPPEKIMKTIGLYIPEALVVLVGEEYRPKGQEFFGYFTQKADEVMADGTDIFPAAGSVIPTLSDQGFRVGIVSTKFRYRIEAMMEDAGLLDYLEVIIGGEDVTRHKPDPESLTLAAGKLGIDVGDCVYVGDSHVDAGAAQRAGMPFVGVLSGTTAAEVFYDYPNVAVLPGIEGLTGKPFC
ncbi:MAG: HAD-IA family hydrolase [Dehalococcoidia bacterium]|nr:HAD-IA family hydrolase [Dehalococcoidia bacterium]